MNLPDIQIAAHARIQAAQTAGTVMQYIKYQDKSFEHNNRPYAEIMIEPMESEGIGPSGDFLRGFVLVNIYVPEDQGIEYPAQEAQKFLDLFPRGEEFNDITIVRSHIDGARDDPRRPKWRYTPMMAEYSARHC